MSIDKTLEDERMEDEITYGEDMYTFNIYKACRHLENKHHEQLIQQTINKFRAHVVNKIGGLPIQEFYVERDIDYDGSEFSIALYKRDCTSWRNGNIEWPHWHHHRTGTSYSDDLEEEIFTSYLMDKKLACVCYNVMHELQKRYGDASTEPEWYNVKYNNKYVDKKIAFFNKHKKQMNENQIKIIKEILEEGDTSEIWSQGVTLKTSVALCRDTSTSVANVRKDLEDLVKKGVLVTSLFASKEMYQIPIFVKK